MYLRVYKPTIMFFSLTNSLATFQAMMNDILKDLIGIGDVVAFIGDILIETEDKKEYNEIVEGVLKRIETNDLYMKSEKCMWKVKKIDFLGLVMETKDIKIQKEKIVGVLE